LIAYYGGHSTEKEGIPQLSWGCSYIKKGEQLRRMVSSNRTTT
jgi:hypothetical protein